MGMFDVEPPRWLTQSVNQPTPQSDPKAGAFFGGLLNMLSKNPETQTTDPETGKKQDWTGRNYSFAEGQAVARLQQQDPLWRQKWDLTKQSQQTNLEIQRNALEEKKRELEDAQALSPFLALSIDEQDAAREYGMVPQTKSKWGTQMKQKSWLAGETLDLRRQAAENQSLATRATLNTQRALWKMYEDVASETDQAKIMALMQNGQWTKDASDALAAAPKKTKGERTAEVRTEGAIQLEQKRQEGRVQRDIFRQQEKRDFEALRQENRLRIESTKIQGKVDLDKQRAKERFELLEKKYGLQTDLETLKAGLKSDSTGKELTEDGYVKQHFNQVFNALRQSPPVGEPEPTVENLIADTQSMLRESYRWLKQGEKAKPATTTAPRTATKPATPSTTPATQPEPEPATPEPDKDPMNLFK